MTPITSAAEFASQLNAERDGLKELIALLETEQKFLIDGNAETLQMLSDSKTRAVHKLSKLANKRKEVLRVHSDAIKAQGIVAWLQIFAPSSLSGWQEIQQLVALMQQLNRTNGNLIQTQLRHNQQSLAVLLNVTHSAQGLYGANGQTHISSTRRILGSV